MTAANVFDAECVIDLYEKHLTESPVPPSRRTANLISAELEKLILRCLEKDPNLRPQTVGELRALLLTLPSAENWTLAARAAWWDRYQNEIITTDTQQRQPPPSPMDATVKIDFASRIK